MCCDRWSVGKMQVATGGDRCGGAVGDYEIGRCDISRAKDARDGTGEVRVEQDA